MANASWEAIDPSNWTDVPFVSGRMATKPDVQEGRAVFFMENYEAFGGGPYNMALPVRARWREDAESTAVEGVIIQAERGERAVVLVGFRPFSGGAVLAPLSEFEVMD